MVIISKEMLQELAKLSDQLKKTNDKREVMLNEIILYSKNHKFNPSLESVFELPLAATRDEDSFPRTTN
jgi:hypothetical protein